MNIATILDQQRRAVKFESLFKNAFGKFRGRNLRSVPIFTFGMQRSGTSMLMNVLHLRPDTEVIDESRSNRAFLDYRLKTFDEVERLIHVSWADYVCFKPISDSHQVSSILHRFPDCRTVWIYRSYADVANSRLRKFPAATRAIKLVCSGKPGGGWFDDGVSEKTRKVLRNLDQELLTEFDYACLTWWARNQIYIEHELWRHSRVVLVKYERLVTTPIGSFQRLFDLLGMASKPRSLRHVHQSSIRKNYAPDINSQVETLCSNLLAALDARAL